MKEMKYKFDGSREDQERFEKEMDETLAMLAPTWLQATVHWGFDSPISFLKFLITMFASENLPYMFSTPKFNGVLIQFVPGEEIEYDVMPVALNSTH